MGEGKWAASRKLVSETENTDPREAVCFPLPYLLWVMGTLSPICDDRSQKLYIFTSIHNLNSY